MKAKFFAVVHHGGQLPDKARGVFTHPLPARMAYKVSNRNQYTKPPNARIYGYATEAEALKADISDMTGVLSTEELS